MSRFVSTLMFVVVMATMVYAGETSAQAICAKKGLSSQMQTVCDELKRTQNIAEEERNTAQITYNSKQICKTIINEPLRTICEKLEQAKAQTNEDRNRAADSTVAPGGVPVILPSSMEGGATPQPLANLAQAFANLLNPNNDKGSSTAIQQIVAGLGGNNKQMSDIVGALQGMTGGSNAFNVESLSRLLGGSLNQTALKGVLGKLNDPKTTQALLQMLNKEKITAGAQRLLSDGLASEPGQQLSSWAEQLVAIYEENKSGQHTNIIANILSSIGNKTETGVPLPTNSDPLNVDANKGGKLQEMLKKLIGKELQNQSVQNVLASMAQTIFQE